MHRLKAMKTSATIGRAPLAGAAARIVQGVARLQDAAAGLEE
jgi:hypothetical protein